ncbi:MAG: polysaccharide deacetylase family protein [Verrucomicrobia bacterium]|nr:polysaccharide deacetylase family protein [Verrucomicrobiota bacterium]NBU68228.1 polysaccharide deacetylase family protein [Verrucomicrobiota bacterium]NDC01008.1 polysaccharide deacetylase family protein [Verrucomicrobiota bacterium]NDF17672.1 polysaccharide deacetylase family protein [Verrucomicrobiota bacterium]
MPLTLLKRKSMRRNDFLRMLAMAGAGLAVPGRAQNGSVGEAGEVEINPAFINSGPGFGNKLALTFDDGPTPGITERVLAELKKRDMRATFFLIGAKVDARPDLARRLVDEGHDVANHSYTHPRLSGMSDAAVDNQITRTQEAIARATGVTPVWFRPPYGAFRREQGPLASKHGLGVAYWSVDPKDWSQPGSAVIAQRVLAASQPGSIILLHDLHPQTAEAVPAIFDGLISRSFATAPFHSFVGSPYA